MREKITFRQQVIISGVLVIVFHPSIFKYESNHFPLLANPLGVLIASGLAPLIVNEPNQIKLLVSYFPVS